ncbi:T9SS type A sorting domain-containing protein [Flavobacterium sp. 25HG05S-40]|uniref:T9SS type A sorting domain-containing protein n=1 Tax=Flavobacterium sp. 25HG05S-40 TaxID=3458682 RepID=UPI004043DC8C
MKCKLTLVIVFYTLVSFSQSGDLDTSFGVNGKVVTGFGSSYNKAVSIVTQPDGKMIVGGSCQIFDGSTHFALARYNPNGTLDATFGANGKTVPRVFEMPNQDHVENNILSLVLLDSGKFLTLGTYGIGNAPSGLVIARFNTDGTIDTTFGTAGLVMKESGSVKEGLKMLPDGKFIIITGDTVNYGGNNMPSAAFERYTQDGVLDTTFGTDGKVVTSFGNGYTGLTSMAILPDGKFVAAGSFSPPSQNTVTIIAAKYNADGSLDTTFDTDGKVTTTFGTGTNSYGVFVSANSDGKITVAGTVFTASQTIVNFGLVQYNLNGSLDTTFDGDGKALSLIDDGFYQVKSISKDANGNYLVNFSDGNPSNYSVIRKYNADISFDESFGSNGQFNTLNSGYGMAENITVTSDSKIIMLRSYAFGLTKYNANGTLDTTFDTDGMVITEFEYSTDDLKKVVVLPDDKIIAIGTSRYRQPNNASFSNIVLSRYNSNGSLDTSYGDLGKVYSVFGENVYTIMNAFVQTDGKLLVNAYYYVFPSYDPIYELIRYNSNGSLDTTFGNNGKIITSQGGFTVLNPSDGKLLFYSVNYLPSGDYDHIIKRYNNDGSIDTTFGTNGAVTYNNGNSPYDLKFALQQDGKILVSGTSYSSNFNSQFFTVRYNDNGSLDTTFGTNGQITTPMQGYVHSNFVQSDGKIVLVGLGGAGVASISYNSNGTMDTTYGTNGIAFSSLDNYNQINAIYLQPDNKLLVALSQYNPQQNPNDFKIKRITDDGTIDTDFGGDNGINTSFYNGYNEAFSIGLQSDNKIIIAGTTNNAINNNFALTRLNNIVLDVDDFHENELNLIIYPNPAKDILKIMTSTEIEIQEYLIYNMLGEIVFRSFENNLAVDVSHFNSGIYNLRIKTDKGTITKKFIKE